MNHPTLAGTTLDRYYHICAFFNSRDEEYDVLSPFFKEGLEWGEKEMHIVDPALIDDHVARLEAHGIAASACMACQQLQILSWNEAYLPGGRFDQDRMLETVEAVFAAGRDAGYPRLRIMGNMGGRSTVRRTPSSSSNTKRA